MRPTSRTLLTGVMLAGIILAAPRLVAQEPPVLHQCATPSQPIGLLSGSGSVRFRITEKGRVDSASIEVSQADGASPEGILSVARRWLPRCRYRAARQAGHAVALTVEQPLRFPVTGLALSQIHAPGWQVHEEMPTVYDCRPGSLTPDAGHITLAFVIDTAGRPEASTVQLIATDVPASRVQVASVAAMCRYVPARDRGAPVAIAVSQQFIFGR